VLKGWPRKDKWSVEGDASQSGGTGVPANTGQGLTPSLVILWQWVAGWQWSADWLVAVHGHSGRTLAMTMVGSTSFNALAALLYSGSSFCGEDRGGCQWQLGRTWVAQLADLPGSGRTTEHRTPPA
jgi:hypothetical protein